MFICNTCLESFTNPESGFKSRGPCEVCGAIGLCNDIAAKYLEAKPVIQRIDPEPFREGITIEESGMTIRKLMTKEEIADTYPEFNIKLLEDRIKDLRQMGYLPLEQI